MIVTYKTTRSRIPGIHMDNRIFFFACVPSIYLFVIHRPFILFCHCPAAVVDSIADAIVVGRVLVVVMVLFR